MAFAKHNDSNSIKTKNISGILETFLMNKTNKKQPIFNTKSPKKHQSNNHSCEKTDKNNKNTPSYAFSLSEFKPKNTRSSYSRTSHHNNFNSSIEKSCVTENDEFCYLDKIKKKIEKTLASKNTDKNIWENEDNNELEENNEEGSMKEVIHRLQLKDAVNRQEIARLKSSNEKLVKRVLELEEITGGFKQNKEKENKAFSVIERELSTEKRKVNNLENKLRKINPVKSKSFLGFSWIFYRNFFNGDFHFFFISPSFSFFSFFSHK